MDDLPTLTCKRSRFKLLWEHNEEFQKSSLSGRPDGLCGGVEKRKNEGNYIIPCVRNSLEARDGEEQRTKGTK